MATIRKLKSKRFFTEVRRLGQYKSKTFTTKVQAMSWAAETEQSLSSDTLVRGKTLSDIFERYRDEITPHKKSRRTEHNRLNKFMRHSLSVPPLADIKQSHFHDWITAALTNFKSSSVNR
ncbi:MAG: hypothetical protein L3K25_19265 [Gammaproteobacteria bacterium]|nr:hypothetical protein [Gammaproteobacteria bacterium]